MQKAVLCSPSMTSGKAPGPGRLRVGCPALVSVFLCLAAQCCQARSSTGTLAKAAVLGMVPAHGRPGAGHRCDQLSRPSRVLLIGLSRPGGECISLERTGRGDCRDRHLGACSAGATPRLRG